MKVIKIDGKNNISPKDYKNSLGMSSEEIYEENKALITILTRPYNIEDTTN